MTAEPEWPGLVRAQNWNALSGRRLFYLQAEQAALLDALKQIVPMTNDVNGTETQTRHMTPTELGRDPRAGAAKILLLGELEAAVRGAPEDAGQVWQTLRDEVQALMEGLAGAAEATKGAARLSRRQHARALLDLLDDIDRSQQAMLRQLDDAGDRHWMAEALAETAALALRAGALAQAAHGKAIEADAVRGARVIAAARKGADMTRRAKADSTTALLERMGDLIARGQSQSNAAAIAHREGLGSSADANPTPPICGTSRMIRPPRCRFRMSATRCRQR